MVLAALRAIREYGAEQQRVYWARQGRKEVVKWMKANSSDVLTQAGLFQVTVPTDELHAKLKEWGVENA